MGYAAGVPAGIQAIGTTMDGAIAIETAHRYQLTDERILTWNETDTVETTWPTP